MMQNSVQEPSDARWFRHMLLIAATVLIISGMALMHTRAVPAAAPIPAPAAQGYTAYALDNHIAIYNAGETSPALVTDIDVRALPLADQEALRQGIPLADDEALAHLLEDYGS
ncbi:BofC C-terminal domain-containing protein [Intestinibacillus massiliensis]|uniref:BofC C-terminal domain-containing protein n=1 Tax=Intestinibacillus massiliensis TaxID=1871029 RepID=UPI000B34FF88|nr:BofC C-terminal domain-containing protein [Intestinibacillus massiliensis]